MCKITAQKFLQLPKNILVIDVRTKMERSLLPVIPNSIHCYYQDITKKPDCCLPNKQTFAVVYCNAGNRSSWAVRHLRQQGYSNVFVLEGGVYQYRRYRKKTT